MSDSVWRPSPWHETSRVFSSLVGEQIIDWSLTLIGVEEANKKSLGENVCAAIIDSGVDDSHPDLAGQVISHANFSRSLSAADDNDHGTMVAYCFCGVDDATGGRGVAPKAKVRSYKVLGHDGTGSGQAVAAGIKQALDDDNPKNDILNLSLGSPFEDPLITRWINHAIDDGRIVIAAAGNSGPDNRQSDWPAAIPPVIAVAAIDQDGQISRFSSRGRYVDYAAPGADVLVAKRGGGWVRVNGTSFASPFLAGIVALILSVYKSRGETLTLARLNAILMAATIDIGQPGFGPNSGWGIVDARKLNFDGGESPEPDERKWRLSDYIRIPSEEGGVLSLHTSRIDTAHLRQLVDAMDG